MYTIALISYTKTFSAGAASGMYNVISKLVHQALSGNIKQYFGNCILLHRATEKKSPLRSDLQIFTETFGKQRRLSTF